MSLYFISLNNRYKVQSYA